MNDGKYWGHDAMQRIHSQKPRNRIGQAFWAGFCVAVIGAIAVAMVLVI